jgi:RNA polymerase sigma-70 factor (ECF subfamily)
MTPRQATSELVAPRPFAALYAAHRAGVYATALRVLGRPCDAEDVTQEVFGPYLRLMARSRALDLLRHEQADGRARDRLQAVSPRDEAPTEERPPDAAERHELRATLRGALRTLPPEQREALVLAYWGGLSAREVAARAGVPFGTARSRMRLGLEKLRSDTALPGAS